MPIALIGGVRAALGGKMQITPWQRSILTIGAIISTIHAYSIYMHDEKLSLWFLAALVITVIAMQPPATGVRRFPPFIQWIKTALSWIRRYWMPMIGLGALVIAGLVYQPIQEIIARKERAALMERIRTEKGDELAEVEREHAKCKADADKTGGSGDGVYITLARMDCWDAREASITRLGQF